MDTLHFPKTSFSGSSSLPWTPTSQPPCPHIFFPQLLMPSDAPSSISSFLLLCSCEPLAWWAVVCCSIPPRPVCQQNRQSPQPQSLAPSTPYFQGRLWHLTPTAPQLFPLAGLHFSVKLDVASALCPLPPVMLHTLPECTNTTHAFSYICFIRSRVFNSGTVIHAFAFLGDINTSSYIQNEKGSSNSIETGL